MMEKMLEKRIETLNAELAVLESEHESLSRRISQLGNRYVRTSGALDEARRQLELCRSEKDQSNSPMEETK